MNPLRDLPPVDALAAQVDAPRALAVAAARAVLAERRAELLGGAGDEADLGERARAWVRDVTTPSLRRVLNATGVIVHTNLGRAPLAAAAREAVARAAEGYSNLELDLETGGRGSRHAHVEGLLRELTGAEAALAVNNGAGAALLAAAALAGPGKEVVVSRGQLVEIGGGFRVPDVIAQAGARLVEVGTTNRTRLADYEGAITADTRRGAARAPVELPPARVRRGRAGRGAVRARRPGDRRRRLGRAHRRCTTSRRCAAPSRPARRWSASPATSCSVGRRRACSSAARTRSSARGGTRWPGALRLDKLSLAALEATLRLHRDAPEEVPVLAMLGASREALQRRAETLAAAIGGRGGREHRARRRRSAAAARAAGPCRRARRRSRSRPRCAPAIRR